MKSEIGAASPEPTVHDWFAIQASYNGECLKLRLQWRRYSPVEKALVPVENRVLAFSGVDDADAKPTSDVQSKYRTGLLGRAAHLLLRLLGSGHEREYLQSARDLIAQVAAQGAQGEPMDEIETCGDGFVVHTHVGGYYYVRATDVRMDED